MANNKFLEMLWYKKSISMLISLRELTFLNKQKVSCSLLTRKSNCTYSHALRTLNVMEKAKLVEFEKDKREKNIILTNKGAEIVNSFEIITKILLR